MHACCMQKVRALLLYSIHLHATCTPAVSSSNHPPQQLVHPRGLDLPIAGAAACSIYQLPLTPGNDKATLQVQQQRMRVRTVCLCIGTAVKRSSSKHTHLGEEDLIKAVIHSI